jgi:hypothetical protein
MRDVAPPCHAKEPVNIAEDWAGSVHCSICGQPINAAA